MNNGIIFKSKIRAKFFIPFLFRLVILFCFLKFVDFSGVIEPLLIIYGVLLLVIVFDLFMIAVRIKTYYKIHENKLLIKCLLWEKKIEITNILEVSPSKNYYGGYGMSKDRLSIKYGKYNTILISPKDKIGFLKTLQKINSAIILDKRFLIQSL
jgi:hypothetical protein